MTNYEMKFLSYGAVINYSTMSYYSNRDDGTSIRAGLVISEVNNKDPEARINVVCIGKSPIGRYDTQITDGDLRGSYARSSFGFTQISVKQICEILEILPRYETEEIHIRSIRATLGGVSEYKADELFSRAIQGYIQNIAEEVPVIQEPAVKPEDLRTTEDPLIKRSLTVPAMEESNEPSIIDTTIVVGTTSRLNTDQIPDPEPIVVTEPTAPKVRHVEHDACEFVRILHQVQAATHSENTIQDLETKLNEIAIEHGYETYSSLSHALSNRSRTKTESEKKLYIDTRTELAERKRRLVRESKIIEKSLSQFEKAGVFNKKTSEPEVETEVIAEEPVEETPQETTSMPNVIEPSPYEMAKLTFHKTCRAKNLDLVSGVSEVKAVLNDLYHAPDLSEFAKKYKYKKNREKLIAKIRSLCFNHGMTYSKEIEVINENRAKVGLKPIIETA